MNRKSLFYIIVTFLLTVFITVPITTVVIAEQSGLTPESGTISRIKEIYDSLVTGDKGSDTAGSWGDWGAMWNRIYSAAENSVDYSLQQYSERDNYAGSFYTGLAPEDYTGEESVWTDHTTGTDAVWRDERTSVYWSADRGVLTTNNFTAISLNTCDFFDENLYPTRAEYPGGDVDCGDAINYCATLDYGGRTDWYLPTQQELMQGYMDGMYNQAGATPADAATFTYGTGASAGYAFWSSSEVSNNPTGAWRVTLHFGSTTGNTKTVTLAVRCVARN